MCSCQAYGKTGVPNARGNCLVCGEPVWVDEVLVDALVDAVLAPSDVAARDFARDAVGHGCFAINLEGQVEAFVPSIRDRLIERGALYQDADTVWQLRWTDLDLERERASDMSCCDFCSARPVTWVLPCVDFAMPATPGSSAAPISVGDWAACEPCGAAVAAGDKPTLLQRGLAAQPAAAAGLSLPRPIRKQLLRTRQEIQRRFWAHYRGGALRVTPHPYGH